MESQESCQSIRRKQTGNVGIFKAQGFHIPWLALKMEGGGGLELRNSELNLSPTSTLELNPPPPRPTAKSPGLLMS